MMEVNLKEFLVLSFDRFVVLLAPMVVCQNLLAPWRVTPRYLYWQVSFYWRVPAVGSLLIIYRFAGIAMSELPTPY
jgi:hypothetical protein